MRFCYVSAVYLITPLFSGVSSTGFCVSFGAKPTFEEPRRTKGLGVESG